MGICIDHGLQLALFNNPARYVLQRSALLHAMQRIEVQETHRLKGVLFHRFDEKLHPRRRVGLERRPGRRMTPRLCGSASGAGGCRLPDARIGHEPAEAPLHLQARRNQAPRAPAPRRGLAGPRGGSGRGGRSSGTPICHSTLGTAGSSPRVAMF